MGLETGLFPFAAKVRMPRSGRSDIDIHKDENNNTHRRTEELLGAHISAFQKLHALHHDPPGEDTLSPASPWVAQRYIHGRGCAPTVWCMKAI